MADALCAALAFAASYAGFGLLALRQKPHLGAVSGSKRRSAVPAALLRRLLALGSLALVLSFALSLLAQGPSFGGILFSFVLAAGALGVMFTLSYRPRWLRPLLLGSRVEP